MTAARVGPPLAGGAGRRSRQPYTEAMRVVVAMSGGVGTAATAAGGVGAAAAVRDGLPDAGTAGARDAGTAGAAAGVVAARVGGAVTIAAVVYFMRDK